MWKAQEQERGPTRADERDGRAAQEQQRSVPSWASPERAATWDPTRVSLRGKRSECEHGPIRASFGGAEHGCGFSRGEEDGRETAVAARCKLLHRGVLLLGPGELLLGSAGASVRRKLMSNRELPTLRGADQTWKVVRRLKGAPLWVKVGCLRRVA